MKKTMIALAATIIAGACVFFACSKEENMTCDSTSQSKDSHGTIFVAYQNQDKSDESELNLAFDSDLFLKKLDSVLNNELPSKKYICEDVIAYKNPSTDSTFDPVLKISVIDLETEESESLFVFLDENRNKNVESGYVGYSMNLSSYTITCHTEDVRKCNQGYWFKPREESCYPIYKGKIKVCKPCTNENAKCSQTTQGLVGICDIYSILG